MRMQGTGKGTLGTVRYGKKRYGKDGTGRDGKLRGGFHGWGAREDDLDGSCRSAILLVGGRPSLRARRP